MTLKEDAIRVRVESFSDVYITKSPLTVCNSCRSCIMESNNLNLEAYLRIFKPKNKYQDGVIPLWIITISKSLYM